jgi:hypothetical protein
MTTRLSIVHKLPNSGWGELYFPNKELEGWEAYVRFLRRMWELGEDTVLETAFCESFKKPILNSSYPLFF